MSYAWVLVFLLAAWFGGITQIARSNALKREAAAAYAQKNYAAAAAAWAELLQAQPNPQPAVRLNLAHALRLQGQPLKAAREYQQVVRGGSPEQQSVAQLQLGNLLAQTREYEQALAAYQAALKADAGNFHARYNFELLKKFLAQQPPEQEEPQPEQEAEQKPEQQQSQAQQGGGQGNQPQPRQQENGGSQQSLNQGSQSGNELGQHNTETDSIENSPADLPRQTGREGQLPGQETSRQRLNQIRMSEERARALLEAMRRAELQYLQQVPRTQQTRPESGKPDW